MGRKRGTTEAEATEEGARERSVTVTYGAFSCTLKGYKHPEDIVKALSEHFKTLAEQAPHFALPPPQVDVALLQQIAAQELRRQMDEGTIDIETVAELARRLAGGGPNALATTKRWLNELDGSMDDAVLDRAAELSAQIIAGAEAQERLRKAFAGR